MFPTACLALFLMLSGVGFLERLGCSICCADVKIGSLKCNILIFFVLLSSIGFCTSLYGVEKYERLRDQGTDHVSLDDRYKLQLFRDQRNWWISGCNLILWLVCWRVQALMRWKDTISTSTRASSSPATPATAQNSTAATSKAEASNPTSGQKKGTVVAPTEPKKER
eukprot:g15858.t1